MAEQSTNSRQNNETHLIDEEGFKEESEAFDAALKKQMPDKQIDEEEIVRDLQKLLGFGESLAKHRSMCISHRESSGLETRWLEDEEFYEGVDDANRAEDGNRNNWAEKTPGQATPRRASNSTKSTVFPNITSPFVDAGTARLADVILPLTGDIAFSLDPTPIPDLIDKAEGNFEEVPDIDYNDPDAVEGQVKVEQAEMDEAKRTIAEARIRAKRAEQCIHDWHVECRRRKAMRKVIDDSGRIGVGVIKGPVNKKVSRIAYIDGQIKKIDKVVPVSVWVDPWNFYPAPDCGEDIQTGDGVWEREFVTEDDLRRLQDDDSYVSELIAIALMQGPMKAQAQYKSEPDPRNESNASNKKEKFEMWTWHGTADAEHLTAAGVDCDGYDDPHLPGMAIMVNNMPIKVEMNNMETGAYPYSTFRWKRLSGSWAGIGLSRMIRVPQKIVTGAVRNLMDNAGLAAGPMIVFKQGVVHPSDNVAGIGPRKVFFIAEDDETINDARAAIGVVKVDMVVDELLKIVEYGMRLAEETTGLPMLLQGQMGGAPDTVGGMRMLTNNAAPPLRRLARAFDQDITDTEIQRYYEYLLLYGPDECKGDYFIKSQGSSTLVERDIQDQELGAMAGIVIDPRFGMDPAKWSKEFLKSRRFDPTDFEVDEESEEFQQIIQKAQQFDQLQEELQKLQPDMLNAETKRMDVEGKLNLANQELQLEGQRFQTEAEAAVWERQQDQIEMEANAQIELLLSSLNDEQFKTKTAQERQTHLENIQKELAMLMTKIQSQEKLAAQGATSDRMPMKPPVEPPGQASPGRSIQE